MSVQDWGEFDGYKFTGNSFLPERYVEAMVCFILKEIYDDLTPKYEREIQTLKKSSQNFAQMRMDYSFCNEGEGFFLQNMSSDSDAPSLPLSASKTIYFEIASSEDTATVEQNGYTGTITVSRDVDGYVVVSSTAADFNNYTFVRINNEDTNYELTNDATITIFVAPGVDIAVEIWNN